MTGVSNLFLLLLAVTLIFAFVVFATIATWPHA